MPSPATHLRAPLLWLLFPLMAGLTAARFWPPPACGLLPLALAAGFLAAAAGLLARRAGRRAGLAWGTSLVVAMALAGFVLLHLRLPRPPGWVDRPPREVTVSVRVVQTYPVSPQSRSLGGLGIILPAGESGRELAGHRIYFSAIRKVSLPVQRTGRYLMRGVVAPVSPTPAAAGFRDHLENLGIRLELTRAQVLREEEPPGWFQRFCRRTEDRLARILHHGLAGHPAVESLYVAMLLGEKAALSPQQQDTFMRSGTFHIFSVSGLHVGVIALALHGVFRLLPVPRRATAAGSLLVLWLYVQVTGGSSPAVRAFLMIAFLQASQVFRLPGNALAALAGSAVANLLLDPAQLFSTGFQMSYSVVSALIVMGVPLAEKWLGYWHPFSFRPKPEWRWYHHFINWLGRKVVGSSAGCWTAFLASVPSGIGYFQVFAPGSLPANLVIVPLSSLAIVGGFASLLTGLVGLWPLSALFNSAAALTIITMDWLVRVGTGLPGCYFPGRFTHGWMAPAASLALTALMLAGLAGRWSRRYGGFWPPLVFVCLLLVFAVDFG